MLRVKISKIFIGWNEGMIWKEIEIRENEWYSRLDLIIYAMLRFKISKIFTGWNMREKDDFVTEMALL